MSSLHSLREGGHSSVAVEDNADYRRAYYLMCADHCRQHIELDPRPNWRGNAH